MGREDSKGVFHHEALLALYHETWGEISRLRDYEWKIAYYFISLSVGLIALLASNTFKSFLTYSVRCVLTIVQVVAAFFSIYYLEMTHGFLTQQRNIRRHIEELLGFYDAGAFAKESVLPAEWKGKRITKKFQRVGLIVPLMSMVLLVQLFSIYIIWKIA